MRLRALYRQFGYAEYRMSRFEEYGLYAENKSFLASGDIITFTGAGGKLMALRPDVTLSIVKNVKDGGGRKKLYYNENIYRSDGHEIKEHMQMGLECIGDIDVYSISEVIMLASRSLLELGERSCIDVSHMGFIGGLLNSAELTPEQRLELLRRISAKNAPELSMLCGSFGLKNGLKDKLISLAALYGPYGSVMGELKRLSVNDETDCALRELEEIGAALDKFGLGNDVNIDFSIVNDLNYYNGVIFQGYIDGIPAKVLSGGRYDNLMRRFGKHDGAIGFSIYLDLLESAALPREGINEDIRPSKTINVALPKGRLGEKAYAVFEASGYGCPDILQDSRKLVFENLENDIRYFWVKPADVAIYVLHGAADIGVVGKDILLENSPDVYELLDLGIGKCRMCVAAKKDDEHIDVYDRTLRVATKFTNIARDHYGKQGREIDVIKLNGSIEIAPLLGLSDVIVDLVETGGTLRENNLEVVEKIVDISARLIANKAGYKFNHDKISLLCERIAEIIV